MNNHKIIFLDIDGVVATKSSYAIGAKNGAKWNGFWWTEQDRLIDPVLVGLLQEICDATGAEIVISSTWRLGNFEKLKTWLSAAGLKTQVLDKTPSLHKSRFARREEIQKWLDENPVESYIILDDEDFFSKHPEMASRWIQTNWDGPNQGIQPNTISMALQLLSGE